MGREVRFFWNVDMLIFFWRKFHDSNLTSDKIYRFLLKAVFGKNYLYLHRWWSLSWPDGRQKPARCGRTQTNRVDFNGFLPKSLSHPPPALRIPGTFIRYWRDLTGAPANLLQQWKRLSINNPDRLQFEYVITKVCPQFFTFSKLPEVHLINLWLLREKCNPIIIRDADRVLWASPPERWWVKPFISYFPERSRLKISQTVTRTRPSTQILALTLFSPRLRIQAWAETSRMRTVKALFFMPLGKWFEIFMIPIKSG